MSDKNRIILERLKKLIDTTTREEIAQAFGCDTSLITKHYNGNREITVDYVVKYAKYFGVSTDYLLGITKSQTPVNTDEGELIRSVCDYTGLNENAVFNLAFRNKNAKKFDDETTFDFLNYLLDYDEQGIFLVAKVAEIKSILIKYTKALANNREKNIELFKCKIAENEGNAEQLKEFLEVTEINAKMTMEKDVGYGKYEAEKLFGYLLDEYIKDAEQEFEKELDIKWQL